ncbi:MAG TPA: SRPBCC family protein [Myxococcota bacterium]|nr:SRPBCC family protein [Myxococcota bacterium]
MNSLCMELTHAVYAHDDVYGPYCTLEEYINCPPGVVFEYLADGRSLAEWTYSLRDFANTEDPEVLVSTDRIGGDTKIYVKTVVNASAKTVDYHCAWDQMQKLWMIYLMRIVPAELVLDKPGSVVLWTNCHHPYYDHNPFPEEAPKSRKVWVGDLWPFFYAGHHVEMQNLKAILEHRAGS